jgi:molybdenum cofactor cytidylyltransferase
MRRLGLILLAAGRSARLGSPKQLLQFEGRSLIRRAVEVSLEADFSPIIVVLGAFSMEISQELDGLPLHIANNDQWQFGMGTSIRAGMDKLLRVERDEQISTEGAALMVGDQPLVTSPLLEELSQTFFAHGGIVASAYSGTLGVPAIFGREFYEELRAFPAEHGAKRLIQKHAGLVRPFPFPEGSVDIDTPQDYAALCARAGV